MSRRFAQHFLRDSSAIDRIVSALEITGDDRVLEIGPGKGAITTKLLAAKLLVAVEVDAEMVEALGRKCVAAKNFKLIHQDILKFDLRSLEADVQQGEKFKIAGNLPYNLTSPILYRLCEWDGWNRAILMVQKEVGDRLCALPGNGDYGALTVGVRLTAEARPLFDLSQNSFDPPPKVKSSVIELTRRALPLTRDVATTQRVIQAAFQQRRKTLHNSLSHGLQLSKDTVLAALRTLSIPDTLRPERLDVDGFIKLADMLLKKGD